MRLRIPNSSRRIFNFNKRMTKLTDKAPNFSSRIPNFSIRMVKFSDKPQNFERGLFNSTNN